MIANATLQRVIIKVMQIVVAPEPGESEDVMNKPLSSLESKQKAIWLLSDYCKGTTISVLLTLLNF